jgi:hypothetical protein
MANERATEEVALHSSVAAERVEDDSGCVADDRDELDSVRAVGKQEEENSAARNEDELLRYLQCGEPTA